MTVELKMTMSEGDKKRALAVLEPLARAAENPSGGLKIIGEALLRTQNERFRSETDPTGKPWEKLSALTVELRGSNGPILRRSGALMRSGAYQVSGRSLAVGLNTIYAGVQQFGATITPKRAQALFIPFKAGYGGSNSGGFIRAQKVTIPARPIVGFGDKDERAAKGAVEDWLGSFSKG